MAFRELLIGHQYATELPNLDRFTKFLTRIKESEFDSGNPIPGLTITDMCKKGLPVNWVYIQFNRGPLAIIEEDEFRMQIMRDFTDQSRLTFQQDDFGFGSCDLNFWLCGNTGAAIESAEALYYMRLYKLKSVDFVYLGHPFRGRVIHEMLQSFEPLGMDDYGTGFTIQWRVTLFVPILRREILGFNVQELWIKMFDKLELHVYPTFPIQTITDEDMDASRELGATETIITSAEDDGTVNLNRIQGG